MLWSGRLSARDNSPPSSTDDFASNTQPSRLVQASSVAYIIWAELQTELQVETSACQYFKQLLRRPEIVCDSQTSGFKLGLLKRQVAASSGRLLHRERTSVSLELSLDLRELVPDLHTSVWTSAGELRQLKNKERTSRESVASERKC